MKTDHTSEKVVLGFWVYILTDCVLFASLFATYAVLMQNTFGGPTPDKLFHLQTVLMETILLLTSSFTCGLAMLSANAYKQYVTIWWLFVTGILGVAFLTIEINEFSGLLNSGNSFTRSGFLSAFFTLVGTHGIHISVGILWIIVLAGMIWKKGLTPLTMRRLTMFGIFWHFLDIIWVCIFSIVYLIGVM